MTRRMPSTHWGRVNSFIYTVSGAFSAWGNILIGKIVDNSGYDRAWLAVGAFGVATVVLAVTLNIMDKKQFYLLYEKKKKERRKDEEKIYEHLSDFGTALSGLWADRGDCRIRWNKIFIVWIGIAVILFALAGLLHMGIWDRIPQIVRWIFGILCGIFFSCRFL